MVSDQPAAEDAYDRRLMRSIVLLTMLITTVETAPVDISVQVARRERNRIGSPLCGRCPPRVASDDVENAYR